MKPKNKTDNSFSLRHMIVMILFLALFFALTISLINSELSHQSFNEWCIAEGYPVIDGYCIKGNKTNAIFQITLVCEKDIKVVVYEDEVYEIDFPKILRNKCVITKRELTK